MTEKVTAESLITRLLTTRMRLAQYDEAARLMQELKDTHAHELAERIREHCRTSTGSCGCSGADLIDPEVHNAS